MAENRVQLGRETELRVPSLGRETVTLSFHLIKPTARIFRGERFEHKPPQVLWESHEEPNLAGVVGVLQVNRLAFRTRLMNRRKDLLHVPRAAFVICRRPDGDEHGGRIAEMRPP